MVIFLTGAAGFIGSHLAERLLARGDRVVAIDNLDPFLYPAEIKRRNLATAQRHPSFSFVEMDLADRVGMEALIRKESPDRVVHLAARAGVRPSLRAPEGYYAANIAGTLNLLETMRHGLPQRAPRRMVFASSSSVYGGNEKVPFSEDDPVDRPLSPYAFTKRSGELLCRTYHHLYGFEITCLRFFTVYGPRQRPDMAIHDFARRMIAGEPIPVFGDGSSRRDYTYIDDCLQGVLQAIDRPLGFEIINLGESRTVMLKDVIRLLEEALRVRAIWDPQPARPEDPPITHADISKARKLLGYDPQVPIEVGIEKFVAWLGREGQPETG